MTTTIDVQTGETADPAVLALSGRVDAHRCPELDAWIDATIAAGTARLVLDLGALHFIDSAALASLIRGLKRTRERGGDLTLRHPSVTVRAILELTRLDRAFTIVTEGTPIKTAAAATAAAAATIRNGAAVGTSAGG